ncbi:MAG TPA: M23 family metallopeptidase [Coleofasciculaceae cyanobacterium]
MLKKIFLALIALAAVLGCTVVTKANPPLQLGLPIACTLGKDCFVLLYPDRDPGPGAVDFGCGRMTYDGHSGTDFAIPDEQVMKQGVSVKSVATGKVLRIRDGVPDLRQKNPNQREEVQGFECGNGVVIEHGKGWETQYCHLRQGSVAVKPGDSVTQDTVLGKVGMSGMASFPHLHLTVRYQGKVVDPFVGLEEKPGCQVPRQPLWESSLSYIPTGLIRAGFAQQPPEIDEIWAGKFYEETLPATSPALVFWIQTYGVLQGDVEQIQLIAPDGKAVVNQSRKLKAPNRIWLSYIGKKATSQSLVTGRWQGKYQLTRGDKILIDEQQQLLLQ